MFKPLPFFYFLLFPLLQDLRNEDLSLRLKGLRRVVLAIV